jgi:hypothetical protein
MACEVCAGLLRGFVMLGYASLCIVAENGRPQSGAGRLCAETATASFQKYPNRSLIIERFSTYSLCDQGAGQGLSRRGSRVRVPSAPPEQTLSPAAQEIRRSRGAKHTGTAVTALTDAFEPVLKLYENYWDTGNVERP